MYIRHWSLGFLIIFVFNTSVLILLIKGIDSDELVIRSCYKIRRNKPGQSLYPFIIRSPKRYYWSQIAGYNEDLKENINSGKFMGQNNKPKCYSLDEVLKKGNQLSNIYLGDSNHKKSYGKYIPFIYSSDQKTTVRVIHNYSSEGSTGSSQQSTQTYDSQKKDPKTSEVARSYLGELSEYTTVNFITKLPSMKSYCLKLMERGNISDVALNPPPNDEPIIKTKYEFELTIPKNMLSSISKSTTARNAATNAPKSVSYAPSTMSGLFISHSNFVLTEQGVLKLPRPNDKIQCHFNDQNFSLPISAKIQQLTTESNFAAGSTMLFCTSRPKMPIPGNNRQSISGTSKIRPKVPNPKFPTECNSAHDEVEIPPLVCTNSPVLACGCGAFSQTPTSSFSCASDIPVPSPHAMSSSPPESVLACGCGASSQTPTSSLPCASDIPVPVPHAMSSSRPESGSLTTPKLSRTNTICRLSCDAKTAFPIS